MTPSVPYQLVRRLGSCQIGSVWSALDEEHGPLAVAVLDPGIATEPRWRNAFAATTSALGRAESGGQRFVAADFAATTPWVAYPEGELPLAAQTFSALGMDYRPAEEGTDGPPAQHLRDTGPAAAGADGPPAQHVRETGPAASGPAPAGPAIEEPDEVGPPAPGPGDTPPTTRPTLVIAAVVLLVLVGGGILFAVTRSGGDASGPAPRAGAGPSSAAAMPTSAPLNPGLEPPAPGSWPAQWPSFAAVDRIRTLTGLDGLPFPVKVPLDWQCTPAGRAEGYARHLCGAPADAGPPIGGELIVRDCPVPCTGSRQVAMRTAEEAWGLRWTRGGPTAVYAERSGLLIDGTPRYVLVVVAYWRGGEGDVDRQLVLRMTAPLDGANQLRRVANYLRDTLIF
ncbi:hypothetical protein ACIBJE_05715 [Micromonospora sp. NPDC050187]|uniref:hypothetical protein n=1 Tax=Micromonospora sp. NPDC050187 TaxID=3364277 RepID=UPI0037B711D5